MNGARCGESGARSVFVSARVRGVWKMRERGRRARVNGARCGELGALWRVCGGRRTMADIGGKGRQWGGNGTVRGELGARSVSVARVRGVWKVCERSRCARGNGVRWLLRYE